MAKGVEGGTLLTYDPFDACLLAASSAVAWVYAIELNITIFLTFKRKEGLYFWSLLISSWGLTFHALGFVFKFLVGTHWILYLSFIVIGWVAMVTGQAFVLYSRLHLVVRDPKILRYVLCLILFDMLALHIPTTIFTFGSNSPANPKAWSGKFEVMERIQLAGFCIQETIISSIYVFATVRMLRSIYHSSARRVMMQLILINFCCVGMDIILICLEYTNKYVGEASIKSMIYALKLKLEFTVLNQMMTMVTAGLTEGNKRQGGLSHELHQGSHFSNRGGTRIAVKDKPTDSRLDGTILESNAIYKTQQIDVISEDISNPDSASGSSTGPGHSRSSPDTPQLFGGGQKPKKSLMGTTHMELGPALRGPRGDAPRYKSPTESQCAIIRHSMDIEKQVD